MNIKGRKLYRSRDNRRIAGVCGGLAKVLDIDARLLRWIFILTAEATSAVYLLLWICLDEEPVEQPLWPRVRHFDKIT
jgi:phage shock protein C